MFGDYRIVESAVDTETRVYYAGRIKTGGPESWDYVSALVSEIKGNVKAILGFTTGVSYNYIQYAEGWCEGDIEYAAEVVVAAGAGSTLAAAQAIVWDITQGDIGGDEYLRVVKSLDFSEFELELDPLAPFMATGSGEPTPAEFWGQSADDL